MWLPLSDFIKKKSASQIFTLNINNKINSSLGAFCSVSKKYNTISSLNSRDWGLIQNRSRKIFWVCRLESPYKLFQVHCGLKFGYSFHTKRELSGEYSNMDNPQFITGFTDGEGCFNITISKDNKYKCGWRIYLVFVVVLHSKDKVVLDCFKNYFKVGRVFKQGSEAYQFMVQSPKDLAVIINHFNKYPLITQKQADFELFKQAFDMVKNKQHLSKEGLRKIVSIKASLNWGLSPMLEDSFAKIIPYPRPSVSEFKIKDPQWLAGFASAEGCFLIRILKAASYSSGHQVLLVFKLTQHTKDEQLIRSLVDYLECGKVYVNGTMVDYIVTKLTDITDKIVPLFQKYPIQGVKHLDYTDFVSVVELMKNKKHLTQEGLDQIRAIKAGMNKKREWICIN